jgi:hypothetical protein
MILIIKDNRDNDHFVQFLVHEDGSLIAKTVSNHYLSERDRWSRQDEAELVTLAGANPIPRNGQIGSLSTRRSFRRWQRSPISPSLRCARCSP